MASIREQILQRIVTVLTNTTGAGNHVYRSRVIALHRNITPAIVVTPDDEDVELLATQISKRSLNVNIAVFTRGEVPDALADSILIQIHSILMSDTTLNGLVSQIKEVGTDWKFADTDQAASVAMLKYKIQYLTKFSDLTLRG